MRLVRFSLSSALRAAFKPALVAAVAGASLLSVGCNSNGPFDIRKGWIDPSELAGRSDQGHRVQRILETLPMAVVDKVDPVAEGDEKFIGAEEPSARDMATSVTDYLISPNDLLYIQIPDLNVQGVESLYQKRVTETGRISLPFVGLIKVAGTTEADAEQAIAQAYQRAGILQQAQVSVTISQSRGRTVSVLGAVNRPGEYEIQKSDYRVLDALVSAGEAQSPLNDTLYIIRRRRSAGATTGPVAPTGTRPATGPATDDLTPPQSRANEATGLERPLHLLAAPPDDLAPDAPAAPAKPATPAAPTKVIDPIAQPPAAAGNGTDPIINIEGVDVPANGAGATTTKAASGFEFNPITPDRDVRVIQIPIDLLKRGQLEYNIPLLPGDTVYVKELAIGEYYMGGHVLRPGAYTLTGRKITIKQAIAAASMLDGLAVPQRTDIVRRLPGDKEVFVRVNLAAIFEGEVPDMYLKPNDQIYVGTSWYAPFIAAARGAFRFTYGFGTLYDRNYAYDRNDVNSR